MKKRAGFTVIELIIVIIVLLGSGGLFLYQKNHIQAAARDDRRKADINTLYHNLEKVYYAQNNSYPKELNEKTLSAVQPDTFKDPNGTRVNETEQTGKPLELATTQPDYRYEPKECNLETGECKSYELRASLETEAQYVKKSAARDTE